MAQSRALGVKWNGGAGFRTFFFFKISPWTWYPVCEGGWNAALMEIWKPGEDEGNNKVKLL